MEIFEQLGIGVLGGLILLLITSSFANWIIPTVKGRIQKVPKLNNSNWEGYYPKIDKNNPSSRLEIRQAGTNIKATITRKVKNGERKFKYAGKISGGQLVLTWEEPDGAGYIIGAMVLNLSQYLRALQGKSTYFSHKYGKVVSTDRIYKRI